MCVCVLVVGHFVNFDFELENQGYFSFFLSFLRDRGMGAQVKVNHNS